VKVCGQKNVHCLLSIVDALSTAHRKSLSSSFWLVHVANPWTRTRWKAFSPWYKFPNHEDSY